MEILTKIIFFILLGALISSPFLILYGLKRRNVKYKLIAYLSFGILTTAVIALTIAWWTDTSNQILLSHYGYDFEAMNETERFSKVTAENIERVKSLEISKMGIGWPIKALITYVFYAPYLLLVYLIVYLFKRHKNKTFTILITKERKHQLSIILTELAVILRDSKNPYQADCVEQILSSIEKEDTELFKQKVLSNELLGGAGSVIDTWIEDEIKMKRMDDLMNDFLELVIKSGLNHRAVKSRMTRKVKNN